MCPGGTSTQPIHHTTRRHAVGRAGGLVPLLSSRRPPRRCETLLAVLRGNRWAVGIQETRAVTRFPLPLSRPARLRRLGPPARCARPSQCAAVPIQRPPASCPRRAPLAAAMSASRPPGEVGLRGHGRTSVCGVLRRACAALLRLLRPFHVPFFVKCARLMFTAPLVRCGLRPTPAITAVIFWGVT